MDQAEKLRNVIKIKNQMNKHNARVITITSGKGGVGKSNIAVNLAVQMKKMGKRVLIFDADFGLANVEVMFGAIPKYNLSDIVYRGKEIREIITEGPLGVGFISGGSGVVGMNNLSKEQILYLVKSLGELDEMADVILVDTGAGIADNVLEFVMASAEVLLVTTPEPSSLTDSYSLLKTLYHNPNFLRDETIIKVVSNRVASLSEGKSVYDKLNSVVSQFLHGKLEYLGMIPQDLALERSVRQQKTVSLHMPESNAARAFETMASNLLNNDHQEVKLRGGITQFFSWFLSDRQEGQVWRPWQ